MGLFDFIRSAGKKLMGGDDETPPPAEAVQAEIASAGADPTKFTVAVEGDTVKLAGHAATQEEREKAILAVGNIAGIAKVEDAVQVAEAAPPPPSVMHTVAKGDTLSAIAKKHYGDANKYPAIFEANKPLLSHPDKIYPGQMLRIPPV
jgi:nucleoid-associated protein YgaU